MTKENAKNLIQELFVPITKNLEWKDDLRNKLRTFNEDDKEYKWNVDNLKDMMKIINGTGYICSAKELHGSINKIQNDFKPFFSFKFNELYEKASNELDEKEFDELISNNGATFGINDDNDDEPNHYEADKQGLWGELNRLWDPIIESYNKKFSSNDMYRVWLGKKCNRQEINDSSAEETMLETAWVSVYNETQREFVAFCGENNFGKMYRQWFADKLNTFSK